ncbi:hypothetical protein [Carnimonas bestiolae]|uniref:hypothetical protein n=1 Tax=Carnimonas bestiolae TaxID=3402172 RepID=UPI003EDC29A3
MKRIIKLFSKADMVLSAIALIAGAVIDFYLFFYTPSSQHSLPFWFMFFFIACVSIALAAVPFLCSWVERKGAKQFLLKWGVVSPSKETPDFSDIKGYLNDQGSYMGFYSLIIFAGQRAIAFWEDYPLTGGFVTSIFVTVLLLINVGMITASFMNFLEKFIDQHLVFKILALLFAVFFLMFFSWAGMSLVIISSQS